MPETNISLTDKVENLPRAEKMYFDLILKNSAENIFTSIKNLRKEFAEDSIEPQYKEAATLALTSMTAHLAGDEAPQPATDSEALIDLQDRIRQAAASGDRETFDRLREGLAHTAEKAAAADERNAKRLADLDESNQEHDTEVKTKYEDMLKDWRDAELLSLRRGGMTQDQAESHYQQFSAKQMEDIARKATGYTHREPLELEE